MINNSDALVYLVRHGEAKPKEEDPERPLSEAGEDDVVRMAVWAAETGIHVAAIWHSGKLRAQQTAEIFADQLPEAPVPQAVSGLAPNDDVEPTAKQLQSEQGPIMLVGHLPFLERLASLLVIGDADASVVTRWHASHLPSLLSEKLAYDQCLSRSSRWFQPSRPDFRRKRFRVANCLEVMSRGASDQP